MAMNINRTLVKPKKFTEPKNGAAVPGQTCELRSDLAHDIYTVSYHAGPEKCQKTVELSVRRTGRPGAADLQIEVKLVKAFYSGTRREELASFSLPKEMAADFIKSCTEIVAR